MTELRVHVDIAGRTLPAGTAYVSVRRGRVSTTFTYDAAYLSNPAGYDLEPGLPRHSGQHYVEGLPGSFADGAPDRWGRNLIDRRRRAAERDLAQRLPRLTDADYLIGVSDVSRQGNLRFTMGDGPFLDPHDGVPPLVSLPHLLASADAVADRSHGDDLAAVKALLDAGSGSLGGARPKASVRDHNGRLLIAKFPHAHDEWDVMAWEKTMLDLAHSAGLGVPANRLTKVGPRSVLLLERFDRHANGDRLGYISAMTMIGSRDGDERDYGDIAEVLPESGAAVPDDLRELFSRVVFNVAVHNTDDHLRNHGFLHQRGGWVLSPMFDVNPNPDLGQGRMTSILGAAAADEEAEALVAFASVCRVSRTQALPIIRRVASAVGRWRGAAEANGIPPREIAIFADAMTAQMRALENLAGI